MTKKKGFSEVANPAFNFITKPEESNEINQDKPEEKKKDIEKTEKKENTKSEESKDSSSQVHATTQGKKDKKLDRMMMAFTPENYEHIKIMCSISGTKYYTQYVNDLVAKDREEKKDLVDRYKEFRKDVE